MPIKDILNNYNSEHNVPRGSTIEEALQATLSSVNQTVIDAGDELPDVTSEDEGKVLKVNNAGQWVIGDDESGVLPAVTSADEGKALVVDENGEWTTGEVASSKDFNTFTCHSASLSNASPKVLTFTDSVPSLQELVDPNTRIIATFQYNHSGNALKLKCVTSDNVTVEGFVTGFSKNDTISDLEFTSATYAIGANVITHSADWYNGSGTPSAQAKYTFSCVKRTIDSVNKYLWFLEDCTGAYLSFEYGNDKYIIPGAVGRITIAKPQALPSTTHDDYYALLGSGGSSWTSYQPTIHKSVAAIVFENGDGTVYSPDDPYPGSMPLEWYAGSEPQDPCHPYPECKTVFTNYGEKLKISRTNANSDVFSNGLDIGWFVGHQYYSSSYYCPGPHVLSHFKILVTNKQESSPLNLISSSARVDFSGYVSPALIPSYWDTVCNTNDCFVHRQGVTTVHTYMPVGTNDVIVSISFLVGFGFSIYDGTGGGTNELFIEFKLLDARKASGAQPAISELNDAVNIYLEYVNIDFAGQVYGASNASVPRDPISKGMFNKADNGTGG